MEDIRVLWVTAGWISVAIIITSIIMFKRAFVRAQIRTHGLRAIRNIQRVQFRRSVPYLDPLVIDTVVRGAAEFLHQEECRSAKLIPTGVKLSLHTGKKPGVYGFFIDQTPYTLRISDNVNGETMLEVSRKRESSTFYAFARPILAIAFMLFAGITLRRPEYLISGFMFVCLFAFLLEIDVTGRTYYLANSISKRLRS